MNPLEDVLGVVGVVVLLVLVSPPMWLVLLFGAAIGVGIYARFTR